MQIPNRLDLMQKTEIVRSRQFELCKRLKWWDQLKLIYDVTGLQGDGASLLFQLLNAVMVLRGIASVPAERLQMKRASVDDDTTQLVLVRPVQPKCVGWSRLDMTRLAACPVTRTSFTSPEHCRKQCCTRRTPKG